MIISCGLRIFPQDIMYAKSIISQLASPEFKGRGYVDGGDKLAAAYIENELIKLNTKPVFNDKFAQEFTISTNTFPGLVSVKINDCVLTPAKEFLVESSSPSVKGTFSIKQVSRKDLSNESKLSEIIRKSETSYLLIDNINKSTENLVQTKKIDDIINYLKYSDQIQIPGVIIYTSEKLTWDASRFQNVRPIVIIDSSFHLGTSNTIDITIESKYLKRYKTKNIAAKITGSESPDSFIVVTAHFDHLGMMGKDVYFPGANDNASGVAMLLNLAKHYSNSQPNYTMVFVALSAEELGLLGAFAFVEKPPIDLKKIKFMINFDLAGTGDEGVKVVNGSIYKKEFSLLCQLNTQNNFLSKIESRGKACNSDHCAFDEKGVPCFYCYTLGGIKAYHDIYDRYETLPLTEFTDYCRLIIQFFDSL